MAYAIDDNCTMCDSCRPVCPVDAISEADPKYTIDPDKCTDCGECEQVCPVGAISPGE